MVRKKLADLSDLELRVVVNQLRGTGRITLTPYDPASGTPSISWDSADTVAFAVMEEYFKRTIPGLSHETCEMCGQHRTCVSVALRDSHEILMDNACSSCSGKFGKAAQA